MGLLHKPGPYMLVMNKVLHSSMMSMSMVKKQVCIMETTEVWELLIVPKITDHPRYYGWEYRWI